MLFFTVAQCLVAVGHLPTCYDRLPASIVNVIALALLYDRFFSL